MRPTFSQEELAAARVQAEATGSTIVRALMAGSDGPHEAFLQKLSRSVFIDVLRLDEMQQMEPAFDLLPFVEALQKNCLLFRDPRGSHVGVVSDPFDQALRDALEERVPGSTEMRLADPAEVAAYLAQHEETLRAMDGFVPAQTGTASEEGSEDLSLRSIGEDTSPVVRLVNSTLYDALKAGASDIHLESSGLGLVIKYRLDGVLATAGGMEGAATAEQVISRVKVLSQLDIAERRTPQDGRFKVRANGRDIDIRVSIMPSIHGEDAVLRILDKERLVDSVAGLRLESLGFDAYTMRSLRQLSAQPYGMLLTTGPTGSGKTTTLYAAINEINHGRDKIITIEDPVEYQLSGVLQIPVNDKKGLTFARGLRSILRHDPDKIMVGEIRDGETAQIAVQAALTGHLVLTTVHANNALDVVGRLTHMGVDLYSMVSALNGVAAQRLVRINCPHCTRDHTPSNELLEQSGISDPQDYHFMAGIGCAHCRGTGFKGRKAVAEVLTLDDGLREMIVNKEPARRIRDAAIAGGTRMLRQSGLEMVRSGQTSLQELNRVVR